jgi:hypothetical protein
MKYKVIVHFEELEIASEFIDSKNSIAYQVLIEFSKLLF